MFGKQYDKFTLFLKKIKTLYKKYPDCRDKIWQQAVQHYEEVIKQENHESINEIVEKEDMSEEFGFTCDETMLILQAYKESPYKIQINTIFKKYKNKKTNVIEKNKIQEILTFYLTEVFFNELHDELEKADKKRFVQIRKGKEKMKEEEKRRKEEEKKRKEEEKRIKDEKKAEEKMRKKEEKEEKKRKKEEEKKNKEENKNEEDEEMCFDSESDDECVDNEKQEKAEDKEK